jgi:hypothetical protein
MSNVLPQAIDRTDSKGNVTKGLWNSLASVLGVGSFDDANKDHCLRFFLESGSSFGRDFKELTERVKERYSSSLLRVEQDPDLDGVLSAPTSRFGVGVKKLHKSIQDTL